MGGFQYERAKTVAEATAAMAHYGNGARPLAGGTDLLVQLRTGARQLDAVVDVKDIDELRELSLGAEGLRLGAAVPCWDLCLRDDLRALYPGLVDAAELIGSMQIQGRATVGGNVCNASPAADTTPALIVCGAQCEIAGPGGTRRLPADQLLTGPGRSALDPHELLVAFVIPRPAPRSADAYLRFIPRGEMDIAVVGAGAQITFDGDGRCAAARIAIGAVAPVALSVPAAEAALVGTRLDDAALEAAAAAASAAARPVDDQRGTIAYRRRVVGVLTRRAIERAARAAASRP